MDINSFLPPEDTIKFVELTGFNMNTPYVFIQIKRIKENIINKYNELDSELDAEFYENLVKNGIFTEDEVFDNELLLTLKNNINDIQGNVITEAFIYDDIINFIYKKYKTYIYVKYVDGFIWCISKNDNDVNYNIESSIKYNNKDYAILCAINFFIDNINEKLFKNYF